MKSALRRVRNAARPPPIPLVPNYRRGLTFDLGVGRHSREQFMRAYGQSGTVYSIVSLLAEAAAAPAWRLYKKQPVDGRRRYSTGDQGSDQRTEVTVHAAISLWNQPNSFHSGFEFREGCNQHEELTGETIWVLDREGTTFPTAMWYVRPDRMEPVPGDGYLLGWMYNGPAGEQIPMQLDEVIIEKRPDPLDPFRGMGPVASILPNIQQQKYAAEYQRNLFINGADAGGVITVPEALSDPEFDEMVARWRETHQGIARAGAIGFLENGATWTPGGTSNKDLEYGNLRQTVRDEMREAWRIHKAMLGTTDDVNRANAQTAQEIFDATLGIPRLNRRRETLNCKLLPMFGATGQGVEFDYDDPSTGNREEDNAELVAKATAAQTLVDAGYDPADVLEVVGLPDMGVVEQARDIPAVPPGWVVPKSAPDSGSAAVADVAGALAELARDTVTLNGVLDATRKRKKVPQLEPAKKWVTDGPEPCKACQANADQGAIPVGDEFAGGVDGPPQHPNCECHLAQTVMKHDRDLSALLLRVLSDGYVPVQIERC